MASIYDIVDKMSETDIIFNKFIKEDFETEGYLEFFAIMSRYSTIDSDMGIFEPLFNKLYEIFGSDYDEFNEMLFHSTFKVIELTLDCLIKLEDFESIGDMIKYVLDSNDEFREDLIYLFSDFIEHEIGFDNEEIFKSIVSSENCSDMQEIIDSMIMINPDKYYSLLC